MSENFAEMFEQSITQMNMRVGEIITGEVVDINRDVVIVNAGLKSEGVIPVEQFYDENGELDVKVGDTVEVALDSFEDGYGESRLSREKAKRARAWTRLEQAQEKRRKPGVAQGLRERADARKRVVAGVDDVDPVEGTGLDQLEAEADDLDAGDLGDTDARHRSPRRIRFGRRVDPAVAARHP